MQDKLHGVSLPFSKKVVGKELSIGDIVKITTIVEKI